MAENASRKIGENFGRELRDAGVFASVATYNRKGEITFTKDATVEQKALVAQLLESHDAAKPNAIAEYTKLAKANPIADRDWRELIIALADGADLKGLAAVTKARAVLGDR